MCVEFLRYFFIRLPLVFKLILFFLLFLTMIIIIIYSLSIYRPDFKIGMPFNIREILYYSLLIFLSGFGASIIIDVDAAMLGKLVQDELVAYYKVAIFIGLDSPVVKSHGGTDYVGFANSLDVCHRIVKGNLIEKIKQNL